MEYGRTFDAGRKAQGFTSQRDLDGWYRYYDHTQACAECKKPGRGVWLDDGFQPTMNQCDVALALFRESNAIRDDERKVAA